MEEINQTTESLALLDKIEWPADLRSLKPEQLPQVCDELRGQIIKTLSKNPGHFASSMGAVELIVALHYVYNTPWDRLVWDVGHQAYAHKLLTGRRARFDTLRQKDGLSGFPTPAESEYDTFTAGHASNSISAALGMAVAAEAESQRTGQPARKTIAVIGDASISGGLAFEGLNNASNTDADLLIILNDNDMSIDAPTGALHRYLSRITTSAGYNRARYRAYEFLRRHKVISNTGRRRLIRFSNSLKSLIAKRQNIFEGLNIRYFGPIDGHNVVNLVKVLRQIKDMKGPRLLHISTIKGKGFAPAEKDPTTWHAPGRFDPDSGERASSASAKPTPIKWQEVFGRTLVELADSHPEVVGITAAMPSGTSMNLMMKAHPDRAYDVGISEAHAVTFAGGLATGGMRPFVSIYSSFLQRAYDSIIHDVAIAELPVTFCIDRAGIVGEDGVTHHGLLDLAYMSTIPGMAVASPMDEATLRNLMQAALSFPGPLAIRYPRGSAVNTDWQTPFAPIETGKARILRQGPDDSVLVITIGPIGNDVAQIADELAENGRQITHIDAIWLKPLDTPVITAAARRARHIITIEDASVRGGLGSAVADLLEAEGINTPLTKMGVPENMRVGHGTVAQLRAQCGYSLADIRQTIQSV